jgi:hypothetical protein
MNFCPVSFLARWFGLATVVTVAMSAAAQQQTIQFTKPVDPDLSSKANAFIPMSSRNSAGAFNAPSPLFGSQTPTASFDVLPGSPNMNAVPAVNAEQWRKFLDRKKNWTLMTPEEIFGSTTPEKILGLTDPKEDSKLSLEERFLLQQDNLTAAGATNGYHRPDAAYWRNDSATDPLHPSDASSRFAQNLGGANPGTAKIFNPLFNLNPDARFSANQKSDSAWANPFGLPEPLPKSTPEQLAGMDRFRALMEPSVPEKTPEPSRFSYQPAAASDPNLQTMPAFNPNGRSFTPLESGISRPTGITPLPGITGPHPVQTKKTPALVQLPPWLSDTPEAFTPLQRKF